MPGVVAFIVFLGGDCSGAEESKDFHRILSSKEVYE